MIAIHDLVKRYGEFTAVDGVTLEAKAGEIHGFLGPNGAGKTTTIRMVAGLLQPTAGRIEVNGYDLADAPEEAKRSLGFIPDRPFIYEKLTAGEFLRFHAGLYGIDDGDRGDTDARVAEMLGLFELTPWKDELVEAFSHGMKQRLVMWRRVSPPSPSGAGGRTDGGPGSTRRQAHQTGVPGHGRAGRCHSDEHAYARSRPGNV
jgi:ABC-2 type transport system ATP-binding protein